MPVRTTSLDLKPARPSSTLGTVNIISVPTVEQRVLYTARVYANNGFVEQNIAADKSNPIPTKAGVVSKQIKHVIFINKENATHDLILGDITQTRKGVPVNGESSYSLGYDVSPNHHELALTFGLSDNFFLEPSVSSDGHRWLTNTYTTEFMETHWPASYGGKRRDSGDDPEVIANYPGRIGFTDANSSPEPNDYNQHGGIYMHLHRHHKSFVNFGNGFEFAVIDEPFGADPTGARQHANVPMEKVVRDNSDHLFPTYNTHIPITPTFRTLRCLKIRRASVVSAALSRCLKISLLTTGRVSASYLRSWISTTRTTTAAVLKTLNPTVQNGRSGALFRTTMRLWA